VLRTACSFSSWAVDLRQLFDRVYPLLVRYIYTRLWDADQAEDIAQEAFVRLLDERPDRPEAWLFTVAGNLARNARRGEQRQTQRLALIARGDEDHVAPSADRLTLQLEAARDLRAALETLSERDRTLLLLHHDGVPYKQLAAIIGVKASSIAPLLARARQRFLRSVSRPGTPAHQAHDAQTNAS